MADQTISQDSKLLAALSYLWLLSVVLLVLKKDDEFVRFHAKQGAVLFIASLFWWIPIVGWILSVAVLVGIIIGAVKAYGGEKYRIPIAADLADKINI